MKVKQPFARKRAAASASGVGAAAAAALVAAAPARGDVQFTNVTDAAGVSYRQWVGASFPRLPLFDIPFETGGAAAGDYDGDGWTDLFVTRFDNTPTLFRNQRNGTFADVSTAAGFDAINVPTNGAAWADVNNDGNLDLYVQAVNHSRHFLFMGDGSGGFSEEAVARGAAHDYGATRYGFSPTFGDYDRDGYLDLVTTEWSYATTGVRGARLHRNFGAASPGHFEDVTEAAGVIRTNTAQPHSWGPRFADLDRDGWDDLAITSDFGTSQLFWNNGDGTFLDGTIAAGVNTGGSEMGTAIADYDGDGRLDWFASAIMNTGGNRLYRNLGNRTFANATVAAGVLDGGWGWGSAFADYDNDADLDLIHTNGMSHYAAEYINDPNRVFRNNGDGTFSEVAAAVGITDTRQGKGLLTFDFDNDGDLDVFIVNNGSTPVLYRNDGGNENPWLKVRTVGGAGSGIAGAGTNRDGFGAWVTVTDASLDHPLVWQVNAGSHYLGQSDPTAFFGLGADFAGTIDLVQVLWPGGLLQEFRGVSPNQLLTAREVNAVPEPAAIGLVALAGAARLGRRGRRLSRRNGA